jgi:hypothetical protein
VILVDQAYESDWKLLSELEEYLLGPLAVEPRVLIVMAGRGRAYPWKTPELRLFAEFRKLGPFTDPIQTAEQLQKQISPQAAARAEEIHNQSGGNPLANYYLGNNVSLDSVINYLLQVVPPDSQKLAREYLEALCVLQAFDEERIPAMLAAYYGDLSYLKWSYAQAREVRDLLVKAAFARWNEDAGGFVVDSQTRKIMEGYLYTDQKERWRQLHCAAYRLYRQWIEEYVRAREHWQAQASYHAQHLREAGYDPDQCPELEAHRQVVQHATVSTDSVVEEDTMSGNLKHSARATPELIGRKEILERIKHAICDVSHAYLIEITGRGGIGKTRLVQHVLEKLAPSLQNVRAAKDPVDLYHSSNHSREGLIAALYDAIGGTEQEFQGYHQEKKKLEQIADLTKLSEQRDAMIAAFIDDLNQIAKTQRLVLALDTTERLFFESDPVQKRLGLEEEKIAVLNWLLQDFLPKIENAVILLSGRTERGSLSDDLKKVSGKQFMPIPLQGLNEEEALEYFDAVIQACRAPGELQDIEAAQSIEKLSRDQRRTIFYSLCDAEQDTLTIRPIWLALAIDYWVIAEQLLPDWKASVNDARARANQDHTNTREALRRGLLRTLREGDRAPADEVILALGLATKGADADLLFHILGIDKTEIQKALETIRHLSFVKTRPKDNRLFLHDEMYAILQQHLLQLPRYEQWLRQITDWYNTRIDNHRKKITRLYETSEKTFYGSEKVNRVRTALYDTLVEDLHYQLRLNPRRGFETYFRYSDDAIATGNESLDAQLRSELLAFWSTNDPKWEKQHIEGLKRADVEADAAIRWVKRLIERGDKPKARQLIAKLRGDASDLIRASGQLAEIQLGFVGGTC